MGERLVCNQEVVGSNPIGSTRTRRCRLLQLKSEMAGGRGRSHAVDLRRHGGFPPAIGRDVGFFDN